MPDGTLSIVYSDPLGIYEPATTYALGSNVRFGALALSQAAELGEPAMSVVEVDDPGGIRNIVGLRAMQFRETAAPSNNQIVLRGVVQDRTYKRSDERSLITGADRLISVDVADYNWHLGSRILVDADAKRPAETPGDRIRWLLSNAAHINLEDYGNVTYPTSPTLEANDYRGQRPKDLLADCAVEGQYNFWCDFNEAHGKPELFFIDPDSSDYASDLTVSNYVYDVNSSTIFAPYDAELRRSPSRIAFGAYVAYSGGSVYVRNDTTGLQYGKLDQTAPMANVKSATRARRIGNKFLAKNNEESDRLSFDIKVPAANVNDIRHGHLLGVRFTHLPGYEAWTSVRVLQRGVIQEDEGGEDYYRIHIEAVPVGATAPSIQSCVNYNRPPSGTYAPLNNNGDSDADGYLIYSRSGSVPVYDAAPYYDGYWNFPSWGTGGSPDYHECAYTASNVVRFFAVGPGEATIRTVTTANGGAAPNAGNTFRVEVYHVIGTTEYMDSATAETAWGSDVTVTVPNDGECRHFIQLIGVTAITNAWVGFEGLDWTRG